MKCRLAFLSFLLPFLPAWTGALEVHAGSIEGSHRIEVIDSSPQRTVLRFEVGTFRLRPVEVEGGGYFAILWDGGAAPLEKGAPALPRFRESIVIADDAEMRVRVLDARYREFPDVRIAPSKGPITRDVDPATVPYEFSEVYGGSAWYPQKLASLGDPYILRDVRGVVVDVNPFRWNPATGTLRVYTSITVEVKATGPGRVNVLARRPQRRVREFEKIYRRHFLNYPTGERYAPVGEVGRMLVIAYDAFAAAAQPLLDWRNQMGVEATLVTLSEVGSTASDILNYVQNLYDTEGLCFLVLVGDGPQIPYFVNGSGAADPMYTLLAGSDSYPDAFVGRISAQTVAQVQTQVERIVEYERVPDPAGVWYARGVAIASNEGAGYGDDGEADWEHARNFRTDLLNFTYTMVDELYDGTHPAGDPDPGGSGSWDEPGDPTASMLAAKINGGRSMIQYTGHGSTYSWATTGFAVADVQALTNANMLPCIVSVGCVNGEFMYTTCFAEAWMRATQGGEPTGAVTMYASTVNQQWATPMRAQDEIVDLLCAGAKRTWGGLCFNGACAMIDRYGANGVSEFKNWTIFGDPALRIRTAQPGELAVSHGGYVDPSASVFEVWTEAEALAALSDAGVAIGSAFADAGGLASITYDPASIAGLDSLTLTVTGFNHVPNVSSVVVSSPVTGVGRVSGVVALRSRPNPFGDATRISFWLGRETEVALEVFDVVGRRVRTLRRGSLPAGPHGVVWDGRDDGGRALPAGIYFCRLRIGDRSETERVVRVR